MFNRLSILCVTLLLLVAATSAFAGHGGTKAEKKGILLVAFGTTVPEAEVALKNIDAKVRKAFPETPVRWAYTSRIIRNKLLKQGRNVDSPLTALAKMADDGFTRVAVQSLHSIPGFEYHVLMREAHSQAGLPKGIEQIEVGLPLLAVNEDIENTTSALLQTLPPRKAGEAVVFMGHGTHHPANVYYLGMQYQLWKSDPLAFMGTVEGSPSLDDVVEGLKKNNVKTVYLQPFMSVAGDHARNDMAGDEPDSWKTVLTAKGFKVIPVLKGTAEFDSIVELWISHLRDAYSRLQHD